LKICGFLLIFAARKRRMEYDITTSLMIIGACLIGLGNGILDHASMDKPKTKKRSLGSQRKATGFLHGTKIPSSVLLLRSS